jgi:hypothetical protein
VTQFPALTLQSVSISKPVTYSFRFEEYGTWCNATVNEQTGEFHIASDWGNWSHRWHVDSLGPRLLTEFLLQCDPDYIVRKFQLNRPEDLKKVKDDERTWEAVREYICAERREKRITKEKARHYWIEGDAWVHDENCDAENMDTDLSRFLGDEPWEFIRHRKSYNYEFLVHRLIPFIQQWLAGHLKNGTALASTEPTL